MEKLIDKITDALCILLIIVDIVIAVYATLQIRANREVTSEIKTLIESSDQPIIIGTTEDDVIIIGDPKKVTVKNNRYGTTNEPRK